MPKKSNDIKHYVTLVATLLGILIAYWAFSATQRANENKINTLIHLNAKGLMDVVKKQEKLEHSDEVNRNAISLLKDKLSVFPSKESVTSSINRQALISKADMITTNTRIYNLNKTVSNIEGSLSLLYNVLSINVTWGMEHRISKIGDDLPDNP